MSSLAVTLGSRPRSPADALAEAQAAAYRASGVAGAPWSGAAFANVASEPGALFVEAWRGLRLVGFAVSRTIVDESELLTISRSTEVAGFGVGSVLLATTLEALTRQRVSRLLLETAVVNTSARRLYASFGFIQVGMRRGYYAFAEHGCRDALILAKCLGARQ